MGGYWYVSTFVAGDAFCKDTCLFGSRLLSWVVWLACRFYHAFFNPHYKIVRGHVGGMV